MFPAAPPFCEAAAMENDYISKDVMRTEIPEDEPVAEQDEQQPQEPQILQEQQDDVAADEAVSQHDAAAQFYNIENAHHAGQQADSNFASGHGGLTFSGPPYVPKAKPYARADYSHSTNRLMKITHDNQLLVARLMSISRKEPGWVNEQQHTAPYNTASSSINRRKAATTIAQENHALYQRLVAIRPSKDISRETLEAEHRRNEMYRVNCATFKPHATT